MGPKPHPLLPNQHEDYEDDQLGWHFDGRLHLPVLDSQLHLHDVTHLGAAGAALLGRE